MSHTNRPSWATQLQDWLTTGQYTHLEPPLRASEAWDSALEAGTTWRLWWRVRREQAGLRVLCGLFGHVPFDTARSDLCVLCCGSLPTEGTVSGLTQG